MSIDTLSTATQNMVVAYGNSVQTAMYLAGQYTSSSTEGPSLSTISGTLIYKGPGRLVRVCMLVTDNTLVDFFDSAVPNIVPPFDWVFSLDPVNGVGMYEVGAEFSSGLVMLIRGASTVNVTYSIG